MLSIFNQGQYLYFQRRISKFHQECPHQFNLLCTFTSGTAVIQVQPVENGFSFNPIEVEFLDQSNLLVFMFQTNRIDQYIFIKTLQWHILISD